MFPVEAVPERIGAYEVLKHVGRSGAADVYTARMDGPLGFSRDVTLKLVSSGLDDDARFADELAREAAICARLNHPVVVRMFDFFEYDRRFVLVLEQVEGASLDRLLTHVARRKQKLGDAAIFFLAAQIGSALAHAHASTDEDGNLSPVIHRDIKPENVLVSWDGNVRLAGFGLGKILGRTPDSVAGTIRGTPGFMSPEQARGERATVRSDVYGFGVLVWSLLTGLEPPRDGARPDPISTLRPDLPRELHAAIDAALEPGPDRRRITCADIVQWLSKLTKPEAGREELRQKVLFLRATRGPASKVDTTNKAARAAKRRAAIQATRPSVRRPGGPSSSRPPSEGPPSSRAPGSSRSPGSRSPGSIRLPPSSRSPSSASQSSSPEAGSPQTSRSHMPTARPVEGGGDSIILKIPPPPALPNHARSSVPVAPTFGAPPRPGPHGTGAPPQGNPSSARPANVSVRTVTMPPGSRTGPPNRHAVGADDLYAAPAPPPAAWSPELAPASVAAPPQGPDTHRPGRPAPITFSLATQLLLAGLTAALVVTVGILLSDRRNQQSASPQQQPPQIVTVEVNRGGPEGQKLAEATPPPGPLPTLPPPVAATSATPATDAAALPPMPDPSTLGENFGYLVVKGPSTADVYLNGVKRGPTNEALLIPCGQFFLRLAPKGAEGPWKQWSSPGQTVVVACKASTIVTSKENPPEVAPYRTAQEPPKGVGL